MDSRFFCPLDCLNAHREIYCKASHCGVIMCKDIFPGFQVAWIDCACLRDGLVEYNSIFMNKLTKNIVNIAGNQISVLPLNPAYSSEAITSGWKSWCEIVDKQVEHSEFTSFYSCFRCLNLSDIDFVIPLMAESIKLGLPASIRSTYKERSILQMTHQRIRSILKRDNLSIIADINNQPVAYCFATFEEQFTHIHDIVLVKEYMQHGISNFLTSTVEFASLGRHIPILRGSISVDSLEKSNRLTESLYRHGWKTKYINFVLCNEASMDSYIATKF
jgi:hypothetical protein